MWDVWLFDHGNWFLSFQADNKFVDSVANGMLLVLKSAILLLIIDNYKNSCAVDIYFLGGEVVI